MYMCHIPVLFLYLVLYIDLKNFYDVTYCVLSMDRWTNQPVAVDS